MWRREDLTVALKPAGRGYRSPVCQKLGPPPLATPVWFFPLLYLFIFLLWPLQAPGLDCGNSHNMTLFLTDLTWAA